MQIFKLPLLPTQVRNYVVSPSSGNWAGTADHAALEDVTGVTLTITTYGRPVLVFLSGDLTTNGSGPGFTGSGNTTVLSILRSSTELTRPTGTSGASEMTPTILAVIDPVAAGTYTYKLQAGGGAGITAFVKYCRLVAWEIGT